MAEVHVWRAHLDAVRPDLARLAGCLSVDETARASRCAAGPLREAFVMRRGLLRLLLAAYLGRAPADVALTAGAHGKPALAGVRGRQRLRFSVSHSGALVVYAVCASHEVGVDVEGPGDEVHAAALLADYCTPTERALVAAMPAAEQPAAILALWVRKEACLKAWGEGLSTSPGRLEAVGPVGRLVPAYGARERACCWRLRDVDVWPDHCAAVAVSTAGRHSGASLGSPPDADVPACLGLVGALVL